MAASRETRSGASPDQPGAGNKHSNDWAKYRVSTRKIEKLTGYRFFSTLPEDLAGELRDHVDEVEVPAARPRKGTTRDKE